jgi:choline dehydrogenase-like flavoprotein
VDRHGNIHLAKTYRNAEPHKRLLGKLKDLLGPLGCRRTPIPRWSVLSQQIPLAGIAHNCGTVRFGADSKRSALDLNCKAHDLDNLYVVDASFFPSSSAVNPGLTTIANALRVGDHLLQRLGARPVASSETNGRYVWADTQTLQPHATALSESTR